MIKKSLFENDLIHGMERELRSHDKKQAMNDLVKAADYLHAALEIFEEAGLTKKADEVLKILTKIAAKHEVKKVVAQNLTEAAMMPSMEDWKNAGVTLKDLKDFKVSPVAQAKVNLALRQLGYSDHQIIKLIGHKNLMTEKDAKELLDS